MDIKIQPKNTYFKIKFRNLDTCNVRIDCLLIGTLLEDN